MVLVCSLLEATAKDVADFMLEDAAAALRRAN